MNSLPIARICRFFYLSSITPKLQLERHSTVWIDLFDALNPPVLSALPYLRWLGCHGPSRFDFAITTWPAHDDMASPSQWPNYAVKTTQSSLRRPISVIAALHASVTRSELHI